MEFRYYITDLMDGKIVGTDSEKDAKRYALSEEHFVVDTETGMWLLSDGAKQEVTAANALDADDEEVNEGDPDSAEEN